MMNCKLKKTGTMILTMAMIGATSMSAIAAEKTQVSPAKEVVPAMVIQSFDGDEKSTPIIRILDKEGEEITDIKAMQFYKINDNTYEYKLEDSSIIDMSTLLTIEKVDFKDANVEVNTENNTK